MSVFTVVVFGTVHDKPLRQNRGLTTNTRILVSDLKNVSATRRQVVQTALVFRELELFPPEMSEVEFLSFYSWKGQTIEFDFHAGSSGEVSESSGLKDLPDSSHQGSRHCEVFSNLNLQTLHFLQVTVLTCMKWSADWSCKTKKYFRALDQSRGRILAVNWTQHRVNEGHELNDVIGAIWFTFKAFFTNVLTGMLH